MVHGVFNPILCPFVLNFETYPSSSEGIYEKSYVDGSIDKIGEGNGGPLFSQGEKLYLSVGS